MHHPDQLDARGQRKTFSFYRSLFAIFLLPLFVNAQLCRIGKGFCAQCLLIVFLGISLTNAISLGGTLPDDHTFGMRWMGSSLRTRQSSPASGHLTTGLAANVLHHWDYPSEVDRHSRCVIYMHEMCCRSFEQCRGWMQPTRRYGEAEHPGPTSSLSIAIVNPTAIASKHDLYKELQQTYGLDIITSAETSATQKGQAVFQACTRKEFPYQCWSPPVSDHHWTKQPSIRGKAAGVHVASVLPMRHAIDTIDHEWSATSRIIHTHWLR